MNHKYKKEIFSEISDKLFEQLNDIKLSSLKNPNIIEEIKALKIIELDELKSFNLYTNYDHYLIFKFNDSYYFCDTELVPSLDMYSMVKIIDFNQILRKDKINKINENTTY